MLGGVGVFGGTGAVAAGCTVFGFGGLTGAFAMLAAGVLTDISGLLTGADSA